MFEILSSLLNHISVAGWSSGPISLSSQQALNLPVLLVNPIYTAQAGSPVQRPKLHEMQNTTSSQREGTQVYKQ